MTKTKLAVCIGDEIYQTRFVKCLMNHYQAQFEVYSYKNIAEIPDFDTQKEEVIIIGECERESIEELLKQKRKLLYLKEEREEEFDQEHIVFTDKYQEVYRIVDCLEKMTGTLLQRAGKNRNFTDGPQKICVFSLSREYLQLAFAVALCDIYGERKSVLLLDLQPFSGLESAGWGDKNSEILGMEDMMAVSATGVYTKGRLLSGIGRGTNFEYVHGIKNPECLAEGTAEIYNNMIDMLAKELGYDIVVINFGSVFSGMLEFMDTCDKGYLLVSKGNEAKWREDILREGFKKRGKEDFFCRVTRFEIPAVYSADIEWQQLAEKWKWGEVGNALREEGYV